MLKSLSSFSDKSDSSKTVPFGVIHTYIAYWGEYLPCDKEMVGQIWGILFAFGIIFIKEIIVFFSNDN